MKERKTADNAVKKMKGLTNMKRMKKSKMWSMILVRGPQIQYNGHMSQNSSQMKTMTSKKMEMCLGIDAIS